MARGHQRRLPYISKEWDANRTYRQLVILVSFKDRDFLMPDPQATYDSIFNYNGYNQRQGKGCVADYFRDQSNGLFNLQFDVYGPIKVSSKANPFSNPTIQTRNYGREQIVEATQTFINEHPEIRYSLYDWDGDRYINQIVYVFAGYSGNVNPNYGYVWPNTNYLDQTLSTPDGLRFSSYTVSAELWPNDKSFGIGTICHEFSHSLGLPDIYPTNGNGYSIVDEWDLMDGGNFTNYGWSPPNYTAMEKYMLGWLNPIELTGAATIKNLQPSEEGGAVYRIKHSDSEWLMLENRQQQGWDAGAPGKGLVIYHVFYDLLAWATNTVNNNNKRRFELIHADNMDYDAWDLRVGNVSPYQNKYMMNNQMLSTSPYPWTDSATSFVNNELTDNSVPPARMNYPNTKGNEFLGKPITNIQMSDDGLVSFDFMGGVPDIPAEYQLTYMVDGEIYKTIEVECGADITPEEEPTKEGYTFSGWSEIPETMPENDVTITGSFTINKYTLTYLVDSVEYKTIEVEYGTSLTPEEEPTKEGHTFSGWSEIPETMPAKDVTITGSFTINKYTLTYSVDGEEYKSYDIEYGASVTPEEKPTKEGYTFSGWSVIPQTMPAKDVTVTGTFTKGAFKMSYMVDSEVYKTVMYDYGTAITPEAVPTKEGYTFSGWSEIPQTMPAKDVTISGSFTINKYTLTYSVDGEEYKSYDIEYGASVTPEEKPTKEGYTFSGWSEIPETMPANDIMVTGSFTINKYTLTYSIDGEEYKSYDIEYGASLTLEEEPTKEGYTFSGWSEIPETMPAKDVTIIGSFTINKYKLAYLVDSVEYKTIEVEYGVSVTPEEEPTKEGHTFSGWSEIPETMPAKDVTISGSFTINKYTLTYSIEGEEYKSYDIEYGASVTPEEEPTKEGYTFSGWSKLPATMPAKDVTIIGSFTINKYTLTYLVDSVEYKTIEVEYGASVTPEEEPTKEGYTFSGWSELPATMPAKDVTITGSFTINKYTLTYSIDGEEYKSYDIEYGASLTLEEEPTKEGYTFSGWSEIPETMPAKDVTISGSFTINKYTLTYSVDGEEYKSFEVEYGASVTPEEEPTKEGYTFSGWSEIPETMPEYDVTITGSFTINKYTLTYLVDSVEYKTIKVEYGASVTPEEEPTKEGYTFSGWSEIPETMPAKDVTISGSFTINKYTLTYMIDNEVYKVVEYNYGAAITPEPQPEGDYVTFLWKDVPETMPANNVTVYADYQTGIGHVLLARGIKHIYSPSGKRIEKLQKGLNIVVLNDGTVTKVVMK